MFARLLRSFRKVDRLSRGQIGRPPLEVETLENRCLPDASHAFAPIQHLVADIRVDLADISADVQKVTNALSAGASATIVADLTSLSTAAAAVKADIQAGASATADITAALAANSKLTTDLGASVKPAVKHQLKDIGKDLSDLQGDLNAIGKDVRSDAADIKADALALTNALKSMSISAAAQADLDLMNADLTKVTADLAAGNGTTAVTDINAAIAAEAQLKVDLGSSPTAAIRHALTDIRNDLKDLAQDLTVAGHFMAKNVADIQKDAAGLSAGLASTTDPTLIADVKALNTDLTLVASEAATGQISASDLNALIAAEAKLTADLGANASPAVRHALRDLSADLLELAIERLAFVA
jgi:hypothetical protein